MLMLMVSVLARLSPDVKAERETAQTSQEGDLGTELPTCQRVVRP